jgi:predicted dehydrogenase/GT2 family glycosyltransferase
LGIIGCGEVTSIKHLPAIRADKGVEVAVAADVDQSRCREVAAKFGIPRTCTTIEEVLQTPDLDAIGICTSPAAHTEIAIAALRAGKHVWVDKPLALNEADCQRMIEEAARAGTVAMTGLHMHFHRLVMAARAAIRRGELGRIESVRLVWHSPRTDLNIPAWKIARATGGGSLVEIAPHHLDLLRFLLETEIAEISASSSDGIREDENAVVSGSMANGIVFNGEFSERSPHEMSVVISGTTAILTIDCLKFEGFNLRTIRQAPGSPIYRLATTGNFFLGLPRGLNVMRRGGDYLISYFNAWRAFFDAIRGERVAIPSFEDGFRATQAIVAALRSREQHVTVPVTTTQTHSSAPASVQGRPIFSVVVPTYNRPVHVRQFLEMLSLQRFPSSDFELILIDDGGNEPLDPIVAPFNDRLQIRLLCHSNQGCAPARQFGISAAKGTFLAFTDDDCRPVPDWLMNLHTALLRHPNCAVIGPTVNALDEDLHAETTQLIVNWLTRANVDVDGWARYGPTCNLALPAEQFAHIGGLNKSWSIAGGEDRDLCARWREAGLGIYFEPQAQVMHYHPLTTAQFLRQHFFYGRGARRFRRDKGSNQSGFRAYNRLGSYARLISLPWRNYDGIVAVKILANLVLAQSATAWGMLVEMCAKRPESDVTTGRLQAVPEHGSEK